MFGLGKPRTALGKWCDRNGLSQQELMKITGINKNTVTNLCNDKNYSPQESTVLKVIKGLRKAGYDVEFADFF